MFEPFPPDVARFRRGRFVSRARAVFYSIRRITNEAILERVGERGEIGATMSDPRSNRRFSVRLDDPALAFCAAHFVAFPLFDRLNGEKKGGEPSRAASVDEPNRRSSAAAVRRDGVLNIKNENVEKRDVINNDINNDVDVKVDVNNTSAAPVRTGGAARWLGESIHGHDFRAVVRVDGPLDASGVVVDFCAARRALVELVAAWNGRLFLARRTPCVSYREFETDGLSETEIRWNGAPAPRRWVFPSADVVWLDVVNASTEEIAAVLLDSWVKRLVMEKILALPAFEYRFSLRLQESPGSFAEAFVGECDSIVRRD